MNRNIVFFSSLAIVIIMADSSPELDDCRDYSKNKLEILIKIRDQILGLLSRAEKTIAESTLIYRKKVEDRVQSLWYDLKKVEKLPPMAGFRKSVYFDKVLNNAFGKIKCCETTNLEVFKKMTLYDIQQELESVLPEVKEFCYQLPSWRFSLIMDLHTDKFVSRIKTSVKLVQKYFRFVKIDKKAIISLRQTMDSCADGAIKFLEEPVTSESKNYSDFLTLDQSDNWDPLQC